MAKVIHYIAKEEDLRLSTGRICPRGTVFYPKGTGVVPWFDKNMEPQNFSKYLFLKEEFNNNAFQNGVARAEQEIADKFENIQYPKLPRGDGKKWTAQETKERAQRFLKTNDFPNYASFLSMLKSKNPGIILDEGAVKLAWEQRDKFENETLASKVKTLDTAILKIMLEQYNKQATRAKLKPNELADLNAVVAELQSRGEKS